MRHLIVYLFSTLLVFPSPSLAGGQNKKSQIYISFSENLNPQLNRFRGSHEAAKKLLQRENIEKEFHQVAKFFLQQKNFLIPKMKIKSKTLNFTFRGQPVTVQHKNGSVYIVNGVETDFAKVKLPQGKVAFFENLVFPKAEAAIPIAAYYFGLIVITVFLAGSCVNGSLSGNSLFGSDSNGAKFVQVPRNELTELLNRGLKEVAQLCGAANADDALTNYDFPQFLDNHCQSLGERALQMYGDHSPNATRSDGRVNPQIFRWAAQRPYEISSDAIIQTSLTNARIQACEDLACTQRLPQRVGFNTMNPVVRERMEQLLEDRSFQRACVERGLQMTTGYEDASGESHNPAPVTGSGSNSEI